jgi:hypothetical protein
MIIRTVAAALIGMTPLLAGCGGDAAEPAAQATPTVSDEEQIRQVITEVTQAHVASDMTKVAALTCAKYRDQASSGGEGGSDMMQVPPMNVLPVDALATLGPDQLAENLGKEYVGASPESVRALAEALINRDEAAYTTAMTDVMAQSLKISVDTLENVAVDGDTATADARIVLSMGGKMSYTLTDGQVTLVREDGQWKECAIPTLE